MIGSLRALTGAAISTAILTSGADASIIINEFQPTGPEWIELYNSGTVTVDLNDYTFRGESDFIPPEGTFLPPGGYITLPIDGNVFSDLGGETSVIDRPAGDVVDDSVNYGKFGSAPLASENTSIARAPDAAAEPVPTGDPFTDGLVWTIAFTPSPGIANSDPDPVLGATARVNELNVEPIVGDDQFELFNPLAVPVDITGWTYFVAGRGPLDLPAVTIPDRGAISVDIPSILQIESFELIYLFDAAGVRVDQGGIAGAPLLVPGECVGRSPDGTGSALGFDFASSDLIVKTCSMGDPSDSVPNASSSWGHLKTVFR